MFKFDIFTAIQKAVSTYHSNKFGPVLVSSESSDDTAYNLEKVGYDRGPHKPKEVKHLSL